MTAWQTMLTACGYCDELPCQCPDPDTDDLSEAREFAALSYARGQESVRAQLVQIIAQVIAWTEGVTDPQEAASVTAYQDSAQQCMADLGIAP